MGQVVSPRGEHGRQRIRVHRVFGSANPPIRALRENFRRYSHASAPNNSHASASNDVLEERAAYRTKVLMVGTTSFL